MGAFSIRGSGHIDADPDAGGVWHITEPTAGFEWRTANWQGTGDFLKPEIVPKIWHLEAGVHELRIGARERGTEIMTLALARADGAPLPEHEWLLLDWSAHCKGYTLEQSSDFANWIPVAEELLRTPARFMVGLPLEQASKRFYRLRQTQAPRPAPLQRDPVAWPAPEAAWLCGEEYQRPEWTDSH
jgi:hypothetical protein